MRVTDATDDTFDSLTDSGTVVVAFYTSTTGGYKPVEPMSQRGYALRGHRLVRAACPPEANGSAT